MVILQNAYNAYLSKKYEVEINQFKEVALKLLDEKIKTIEQQLKVINTLEQYSCSKLLRSLKWDLNSLESVKYNVKNRTLLLDTEVPSNLKIQEVLDEYQKLNDLIVKSEMVTVDNDKSKWDISSLEVCLKTPKQIADEIAEIMKNKLEVKY